jgi:hypothetical protein
MKKYLTLISLSLILSCNDETVEDYPIEPTIGLQSIVFSEGASETPFDTLAFTIHFTDGDADFGFEPGNEAHLKPPYQHGFFYLKSTGQPVHSHLVKPNTVIEGLLRYDDRQSPPYDTLPESIFCYFSNADFNLGSNPLYWTENSNYKNLFVKVFFENDQGTFVELDWYKKDCGNFNGRVADIIGKRGPFILEKTSDKKGELTYKMISGSWLSQLGEKKIKLRIYIQDLALHRSNVLESEPFLLGDI